MTAEVSAATARLGAVGLATVTEEDTVCGYAIQDKVWVPAPAPNPGRSAS